MSGYAAALLACNLCGAPGMCQHRELELLPPGERRKVLKRPEPRVSSARVVLEQREPAAVRLSWSAVVFVRLHIEEDMKEFGEWRCGCRWCEAAAERVGEYLAEKANAK